MPTKAVILLSGGLDSATVLALAKHAGRDCYTLAFDYGQRHRHELEAAQRAAEDLGSLQHKTVRIDLRAFGGSALTDDAIDVPKHADASEITPDIPVTYVPARNLVFLSLAVGYAETLGAEEVHLGVNALDYSGYPDCRPEFIASFERTANLATKAGVESDRPLRVVAPLIDMTKAQIVRRGTELGVDYSRTHSCYDPVQTAGGPRACGSCDSCLLRKRGFADAGLPDPTLYA